jgi:hypothetical protein
MNATSNWDAASQTRRTKPGFEALRQVVEASVGDDDDYVWLTLRQAREVYAALKEQGHGPR